MLSPPSSASLNISDVILEEVHDLKLQLHCKSTVIVDLTKEKQDLVSELEKCEGELKSSLVKIAKSKKALGGQLKSTCLREKKLAMLESKWRSSMERERKEIDAYRSELMHVESSESEEKLETLQYETKEMKRVHHQAIKEHTMYKARQETILSNALRNAESANEGREHDAFIFAETIRKLLKENNGASSKFNALQSELQECQLRMKQIAEFESKLRTELRQELQNKNQREVEIAHAESSFNLKSKDIQAKNVLLDTELHGLRSEVMIFKQDLVSSELELSATRNELRRSEEALIRTEKESGTRDRRIQDMKIEMAMEKERLNNSIKFLESNNRENKIKFDLDVKVLRGDIEDKQALIYQHQCDLVSSKEKADRHHLSALYTIEIENMALKKSATSLQSELLFAHVEKDQSMSSLKQSAEVCQHELNIALKDCRVLKGQNTALEDIIQETKQQYLAIQTKLDTTIDEYNEMRSELVEKEDRFNDLSMQTEVLSSQLRDQSVALMSERKAKENAVEESKISEKKSKVMVQKEKKKSDAYKQKALEAHAKNLFLKSLPKESEIY